MSQYVHFRKRWADTESLDIKTFNNEDLSPENLCKLNPFAVPCFQNPEFKHVLQQCLAENIHEKLTNSKDLDISTLVLSLKEKYYKKWKDTAYKNKEISKNINYTGFNLSLMIPINSQGVKIAYLNLYAENLLYITERIPKNSFKTKQDLMHVILNKNSEILENILIDEKSIGTTENPIKMTWLNGVSTLDIIKNRLGDPTNLVNDCNMSAKIEIHKEDIFNKFQRFQLHDVFEIHRLDFFNGDLRTCSLRPLDEV